MQPAVACLEYALQRVCVCTDCVRQTSRNLEKNWGKLHRVWMKQIDALGESFCCPFGCVVKKRSILFWLNGSLIRSQSQQPNCDRTFCLLCTAVLIYLLCVKLSQRYYLPCCFTTVMRYLKSVSLWVYRLSFLDEFPNREWLCCWSIIATWLCHLLSAF